MLGSFTFLFEFDGAVGGLWF